MNNTVAHIDDNTPAPATAAAFGQHIPMHRTLEHLQLQAQAWGHASQIGEQLARTDVVPASSAMI